MLIHKFIIISNMPLLKDIVDVIKHNWLKTEIIHIAIVGDKAVGKSNYLRKYYTGEFNKQNVPLPNHTMMDTYNTNIGRLNIKMTEYHNVSDISSTVNGIFVMFDNTNINSFQTACNYIPIVTKITNNVVVCGNKSDVKNRKVKWAHIKKACFPKYYDISNRSNYQWDKPITYLIQGIYGDNFKFEEQDPIDLPEVSLAGLL